MDKDVPDEGRSRRSQKLFRQEALASAQGAKPYGTVLLLGDRLMGRLAIAGIAIVALIIVFLATFSTTRKVQWQGVIVPAGGTVSVLAPSGGSVARILVNEGDSVRAGQVMFVLLEALDSVRIEGGSGAVSELLDERRRSLQKEIADRELRVVELTRPMLARIAQFDEELGAAAEQERLQMEMISIAELTSKTYADLENSRYVSSVSVRERQLDLLDKQQRLVDIRRQVQGIRRDRIALVSEVDTLKAQAGLEALDLERRVSEVGQQITESTGTRTVMVRAVGSGRIGTINVAAGQGVSAQSSLATVIPDGRPLEVEMYAPSQAVGLMSVGMGVALRYPAFPYQKFGLHSGRIAAISRSTIQTDGVRLPASILKSGDEPLYRVRVDIDAPTVRAYGKDMPLRSGMLVEGSVSLEKRKLYEWILDPLFTVTGRL